MTTKSKCTLKESKNIVHISEAIIIEDKYNKKFRPCYPTIKDTVQICNKKNVKPLVPTINEVVLLDNQSIRHLKNSSTCLTQKDKKSVDVQKSDKNTIITKSRLINEKKNDELIEKKRLAALRKKKLDQLQKTTREIAKASIKKKITHIQDDCKIEINLPTELNQPEVDQTWSPPPKVSISLKKRPKMSINTSKQLINDLENKCDNNIKNTSKITKISKNANSAHEKQLIEKKTELREVTKPEHLFSKLKLNDDYQLIDNSIFDISTPKISNIDTSLVQNTPMVQNDCNNVKLIEENEKLQKEDSVLLYKEISDVNLSTQSIDSVTIDIETPTGLKLPDISHTEMMKSIEHLKEHQELLINQHLSSKNCYSESTQTNNYNNLLSLFSPKISPPPMNFISVLKCKNNLQLTKQNNLNFSKPTANLSVNEYSVPNVMNNVESAVLNIPNLVDCVNMVHQSDLNEKISSGQENDFNQYKPSLFDEPITSKPNDLPLNETSVNNVNKEKTKIKNEDKLFTKLNITNEDIKHILKNLNYDFDFLTKNNTNDLLHNTSWHSQSDDTSLIHTSSCFPEIHNEFQAEINTLDQLNDSLCDIEKMNCDSSVNITTNKLSMNNLNDHYISNNMNLKTKSNASDVNNDVQTPFSKLNALSSNMLSIDKSITGFSIQMFEQLIKDEELRAKQHHTILRLREKSLMNRLKWEVTMSDLHVKHFKRPSHEKQLQLFKQKHRGSIRKLEYSLSQVKTLGRIIDSVYKERLIMLEEHLQQLKMQSSSKKVIRKLKSLDQIPKKEEYVCRSLNSHFLKQCEKSNIIDNVQIEKFKINSIETNLASKNNTSTTMYELNKSKTTLRNQATSPINIETKFKPVKNANVQTDFECFLDSDNKSVQTSELFNQVHNNSKPVDVSYNSKPKKISESSISTHSDQSDLEVRIITLQKQLEVRKLESSRLKKEQKYLKLANLKAKEQDLLRQINLYDKKIEESRKSLIVELEKEKKERKSIQVNNSSIELDSSSKSSSSSVVKNITNYESDDSILKNECKFLNISDRITCTDGKKYFCPIAIKELSNEDKPPYKLGQKTAIKSKQYHNRFTNNDSVKIDNYKLTNEVYKVLPLYKEPIEIKVNTLKESHEIQTEVSDILVKPPMDTLVHTLDNIVEDLIEKTVSNKKNEDIQNQEILNTVYNQELYLENNINTKNVTILYPNTNHNHSNTSSSNKSNIQRNLIIDFNENDNNLCVNKENRMNEFETLSIEIGVDDDYSPDDNISMVQRSYDDNIIEFHDDGEQNNESSYEEERSEGEVMFEEKTFIEQYSVDSNLVQKEMSAKNVDVITNNILNGLLKDTKNMFTNMGKYLLEKNDLHNLTEETPLLLNLKREEHQNLTLLTEQATIISNVLLKRHLQPFLSETLQMYYLPRLDEKQMEKLTLYLNWSSNRKKLKLSKYFPYKTNDVENDESFEIFYLKYHEEKKSSISSDENNGVILRQTLQEAKQLKLEQMRIEEEIQRLRISEKFFSKKIPNKPPPPYKSPTKKEALVEMPYTTDETRKIVLAASSQLFNDFQSSMSKDYILDSDSSSYINYKTLIFDYCKEIVQNTFIDYENVPVWRRPIKKLKHFRAKPKTPEDLCNVVMKKLNQIVDIDECEEKVNKFVVKQLHEEGSKWTDFQTDEMDIQNDIIQSLMNKLMCDTITNIKTNFYFKF